MKKIVLVAMLSMFMTVLCLTSASAISYSVTYLNTPTGFRSPRATAVNAFGLIAGTAQDSSGHQHAFVWEADGGVRELSMPAGYVSCGIHDMNALGQCVGYATDASDNGHAIVWDADGTPRDLGALDGVYSVARSINIHGQIAGWSGASDGSVHAMLWDVLGNYTDLGQTQGWAWSRAQGVNDSGQVVGMRPGGAFLLSGGSIIDIGARIGVVSEAIAVNSQGDAVGPRNDASGAAVLWRADGSDVSLDTFDSSISYAWSINSAAQIAGWCQLPPVFPAPPTSHAVIWNSTGQLTDINPAGMTSSRAYDINDNGWIVGACSTNTVSYAAVWVPVPEPSSCLALAAGIALLFRFRRICGQV